MADIDTESVKPAYGPGFTEYTPKVIGDLIIAFHSDYTIEAACRYAGISRQSYYNWIRDKEGFAEKMADAQNKLLQKAGDVIAKNINDGDAITARWYKDRRDPRYKAKVEAEISEGQKKYEELTKDFLNDRSLIPDVATEAPGDDSNEG